MGELLGRFNHYGFEQEVYDKCRGRIAKSNQNHAKIIDLWFALINAFYFLSATLGLFNVDSTRAPFFIVFMLASLLIMGFIVYGADKGPVFGVATTVINLAMFEAYSVLSSIAEPYTTCWIFLILMVIVAVSYIETMGRMSVILLTMSVIFCYLSYLYKPLSIASMDLANTVIVVSLAMVLHFAFQRARIDQFVTSIRDIETQRMLEITSHFDSLTGLLNRGKFFDMVENVLEQKRVGGFAALLLLDLDGFKQINDSFGHQAGDLAIQIAGREILKCLGIDSADQWEFPSRALREGTSFAGRLGGDEFIVLLQGFTTKDEMMKVAESILNALRHVDEGNVHSLRASMGITMITAEDENADDAYRRADFALYAAKGNGKDRISVNQF